VPRLTHISLGKSLVLSDRIALFWHEPKLPVKKTATPTPAAEPTTPVVRPRSQRVLRYVLALVTTVLVIDAVVGEKGLLEIFRARRQHAELEQALATAKANNSQLRAETRRLREDPKAIEELARRELGFIRPGEKLFIIKDLDSPKP